MTSISGNNNFNSLLFSAKRVALAETLEHLAGHTPLDLSYKEPARPDELLNFSRAQLNGKYGDLKYKPTSLKSRPYLNYDARFDPTILNAVRNKYVDVSGLFIPNKEFRMKPDMNKTVNPFIPFGIIK